MRRDRQRYRARRVGEIPRRSVSGDGHRLPLHPVRHQEAICRRRCEDRRRQDQGARVRTQRHVRVHQEGQRRGVADDLGLRDERPVGGVRVGHDRVPARRCGRREGPVHVDDAEGELRVRQLSHVRVHDRVRNERSTVCTGHQDRLSGRRIGREVAGTQVERRGVLRRTRRLDRSEILRGEVGQVVKRCHERSGIKYNTFLFKNKNIRKIKNVQV